MEIKKSKMQVPTHMFTCSYPYFLRLILKVVMKKNTIAPMYPQASPIRVIDNVTNAIVFVTSFALYSSLSITMARFTITGTRPVNKAKETVHQSRYM